MRNAALLLCAVAVILGGTMLLMIAAVDLAVLAMQLVRGPQ